MAGIYFLMSFPINFVFMFKVVLILYTAYCWALLMFLSPFWQSLFFNCYLEYSYLKGPLGGKNLSPV
jgi:hypothetical protein